MSSSFNLSFAPDFARCDFEPVERNSLVRLPKLRDFFFFPSYRSPATVLRRLKCQHSVQLLRVIRPDRVRTGSPPLNCFSTLGFFPCTLVALEITGQIEAATGSRVVTCTGSRGVQEVHAGRAGELDEEVAVGKVRGVGGIAVVKPFDSD